MKKLSMFLLACILALSLTACGGGGGGGGGSGPGGGGQSPSDPADDPGGGSTPGEGYDAEYTIYVNGSDEWTPFAGKSGVSFSVSDDKVISTSDNGTEIEFTGKQVGESVITAALDSTESKALVRVREMEREVNSVKVPLILDLPGSYYIEYQGAESEHITTTCLTSGSHANKYFDEDEARYGWNIDYFTPSSNYIYWEGYGWMDTTEDGGWTSGKFTNWLTEGENPMFYGDLTIFRQVMLADGTFASEDISRFDTGETETIAGVECKIYEYHSMKYWVEPTYHFCLQYSGDGENDFTVTRFEAPFEEENPLAPSADDVIHQP